MKITLKRIAAYFIDVILVSVFATVISSNSYINKDYKNYEKEYNEYNLMYNQYSNYYDNLKKYYEDNIIDDSEYTKLTKYEKYNKDLIKSYDDSKITEEEYEIILENLNTNYTKIETDYNYKLLKYSIVPTIVSLMSILLYFVAFQHAFNGRTLGKRIMKLKVVSNNNKKLSILNYFIRSLVVNEVFINILNIIFLVFLSKSGYLAYSKIIYVITYIIEMLILFTMLFDKNNRGIHDYISNTKVIEDKKE